MKSMRKTRVLIAHIPEELHNQVKSLASFRGMSIRQWIEIAIKELIKKEIKHQ